MNTTIVKVLIAQLEKYLTKKEQLKEELKRKEEERLLLVTGQDFLHLSILEKKIAQEMSNDKSLMENEWSMKLLEEIALCAIDIEHIERKIKKNDVKIAEARKTVIQLMDKFLKGKQIQITLNGNGGSIKIVCDKFVESPQEIEMECFFGVIDADKKSQSPCFIGKREFCWTFDKIIEE